MDWERGVGEADVVAVPRRWSRAEAERLLCEYEASGLSREEFCQRKGHWLAIASGRQMGRQRRGAAGWRWRCRTAVRCRRAKRTAAWWWQ
jgi:hypothetical protein